MIFFQEGAFPTSSHLKDPLPIPLRDKDLQLHAKSLPKIIHMPSQRHPTEKSNVSKQKLTKRTEKQRKCEIVDC